MPRRALKPCSQPGCPSLVRSGRCRQHRQRRARLDSRTDVLRRGTPADRGYDSQWRRISLAHRKTEPVCRHCAADGRTTAASEVDHVIPHRGHRSLRLAGWNLQSLCRPCHVAKTRAQPHWIVDRLWPIDLPRPAGRLIVVVGAPGSGKSTYTGEHAEPSDVVIDLDQFRDGRGEDELGRILEQRNDLLRSALGTPTTVYLEATAKRQAERCYWSEVVGGEVVVLSPGRETCRGRVLTRDVDAAPLLTVVDEWHRYAELDARPLRSARR